MYEVMARRYRPGTFDEVVGQEHIAATLKNAINRDRVAHAFMFSGGHGCGKTTMARILAKALNCVNGPTPDPCCQCHICKDITAGRDADVMEIDGASNNGIEQIRQLREQAAYVPTRARYKVYIIDEVHMLSDGAFNALLKTLEEPPRHVKFILATTDPHKVPDTILSRCQRFDFRLVPAPKLSAFFRRLATEEKATISDDALDAVAANAEGSVRDGLVLLDQLLSFADGEVTRQDVEAVRGVAAAENVAGIFEAIQRQDAAGALAIIDEVASRGTSVGDFLDQLIAFGRDLMLFVVTGSSEGASAYGPAREALARVGSGTSLESALLYLDVLVQARTRVRSRALTNPLVALEMAVARLSGLGGVTPVAEILGRLAGAPVPAPRPRPSASQPVVPVDGGAVIAKPIVHPPPSAMPLPVNEVVADSPPVVEVAAFEPDTIAPVSSESVELGYSRNGGTECLEKCITPLNLEAVKMAWERVLDALSLKHPADRRHMARITIAAVRGDIIVLSGSRLAIEAWEDERRLNRLREAAAEVLARPVMFEFKVEATTSSGSIKESDEAARLLARHPAVERIKSLFEGVVVDCQAAGESTPDTSEDDETTSE